MTADLSDLVQLPTEDLPRWLGTLGVPAGWRLGRLEGQGPQPSRIAVCPPQSGRGYACDTLTVFSFTGIPADGLAQRYAEGTLRDLGAQELTTEALTTPRAAGAAAARSDGYFHREGQHVWARSSTYIAGSTSAGEGRLIQHSVVAAADARGLLSEDIEQLCNAVHHAFLANIGPTATDNRTLGSDHALRTMPHPDEANAPVIDTAVRPHWQRTGYRFFPFATEQSGHWWVLRLNHGFPEHDLYTLFIDGKAAADLTGSPDNPTPPTT